MSKLYVGSAIMLVVYSAAAYQAPSNDDVSAYRDRAELYIGSGLKPDQVVASLHNWFGKSYFYYTDNGWAGTTDIWVRSSENDTSVFAFRIATMKTP